MHPNIELRFLNSSDKEHFIEFLSDTPDTAFQVIMDTNESTISWNLEGAFCKHIRIEWRGKELNAWIARQSISGTFMLQFWCAEVRAAAWWASFPDGVSPNDGLRSYRIQEGQSEIVARWESKVLQLTGSEKHLRLAEITINQ